jgi:ketosteroid isomerase-like protein
MKRIPIILASLVVLSVFGWSQTVSTPPPANTSHRELEAELKELERHRAEAFEKGDLDFVDRTTADECTFVHASGDIQTKAHELGVLKTRAFQYQLNHLDEVTARIYGTTAVLNGVSTQKGTRDGVTFGGRYRFTRTYAKLDGRWQLVASHVVSLPKDAP